MVYPKGLGAKRRGKVGAKVADECWDFFNYYYSSLEIVTIDSKESKRPIHIINLLKEHPRF